jgi:N-formylmaleamate deformylase
MAKLFYGHLHANGIELHYYRTGDEKPVVVLLHGFSDYGLCWGKVALALEPVYDVIMPDARGHGLSEAPQKGYGYDDYASDVTALIQELGLKTPLLIGHSMGAQTAAVTAARFPGLIRGIILEDPPFRENEKSESPATVEEMAEKARQRLAEMKRKTFDELLSVCKADHPLWCEEDQVQWAKAKQQVNPAIASGVTTQNTPWREIVRRITCPTLVITADVELGALITPAVSGELTSISKYVEINHIPGAGHSIRREKYKGYLAAINDFLKKDRR